MNNGFIIAPEGMDLRDVDVWSKIYEAKTYGTVIPARIIRRREIEGQGGAWEIMFPEVPGIIGLVPESQTGLPQGTPMSAFVGSPINVKVSGINRQERIVACSRKEAVEVFFSKFAKNVEVGDEIPAVVKFVRGGNLYLDIGGGIILRIPAEKARLSPGTPVDAQYMRNDYIDLIVTGLDRIEKTVTVDLADPWEKWNLGRGEILTGTVVIIRDKLAFIRVKPGVVGLAPYSNWDDYGIDAQLLFQVSVFDPESRKLRLVVWDPDKAKLRRKAMVKAKSRKTDHAGARFAEYGFQAGD